MPHPILNKFVHFCEEDQKPYSSQLWNQLLSILAPEDLEKLIKEHTKDKIPLKVMVDYTQQNFLRKKDQRWALENYEDFSEEKKQAILKLLEEYGQTHQQPFPANTEFALFLGTSSANIGKRAFSIYDAIVNEGAIIDNIIILGTDEPYDPFMKSVEIIFEENRLYFRKDMLASDITKKMTMHEVMCFFIENLSWPAGKMPTIIKLSQERPCNTNKEIDAVCAFLDQHASAQKAPLSIFHPASKDYQVTVVSNQPFNDRQAIVAYTGFLKNPKLNSITKIDVAGPGTSTYPLLNKLPASTMSPAQLIDNLSRALYEISQNVGGLFARKEEVSAAAASAISTSP